MENNSSYRPVLLHALEHALSYLESLEKAPVAATASYPELCSRLSRPLVDEGLDADQVLEDLVNDTRGGILGSAGGRFFGWVVGGALPAALAADWMTSAWDQNAALYACAPAV
jgi:hypothetical protein